MPSIVMFPDYLAMYAVGNTIYVLGGQGEDLAAMSATDRYNFIYNHEHGDTTNINRDLALYDQRVAEGWTNIYCFDCSGLIMNYLLNVVHAWSYDMTAQGLYDHCSSHPTAATLQPYDLVFYSTNHNGDDTDIVHTGVYLGNGMVEEARGRDYGVVITNFASRGWEFFGHFAALEPYIPHHPIPPVNRRKMPVWMMLRYPF